MRSSFLLTVLVAGASAGFACSSTPSTPDAEPAVASGSLALLSPRPGDRWAKESTHRVSWEATGAPSGATVTVAVSTDGGKTFTDVATRPAVDGYALWTLPKEGDGALVQLRGSWAVVPLPTAEVGFSISARRSYRWVRITEDAGFPARDGAGALTYKGKMWLIGGWNPNDHYPRLTSNDVWSSTDGVTWTIEKANTFVDPRFDRDADWEGRHAAGYVVYQDRMWIVGGDPLNGYYQGDVWSSADGRSWRRETAFTPWGARALHHTLVFGDRLWVLGGQTMPDFVPELPYKVFSDAWTSADGVAWSRVQTTGPIWSPRSAIMQGAVKDGRMWMIGGGTYESITSGVLKRTYTNDVWSSADGVSWRRDLEAAPWTPRQYQSVVSWDDQLWVISGYNEENLTGAWYSPDGLNWYSTDTTWGARHATSVWVHKDAVWMTGGGDIDVWRLQRGL